jgi:rhodanese-related sulfurtransferase
MIKNTPLRLIYTALFSLILLIQLQTVYADTKVKITENIPYLDLTIQGKPIRIQRIQDTDHRLTDDFTKTSRVCPPFCIHPEIIAPDVDTFGELELLDFMQNAVNNGTGLVIDSRLPDFFAAESIPTSLNMPFYVVKKDSSQFNNVLKALGASQDSLGTWRFEQAKTLAFYCNGPWCDQSPQAIKAFIDLGYPPNKLKYYRGGLQSWKQLGLTTVMSPVNQKESK